MTGVSEKNPTRIPPRSYDEHHSPHRAQHNISKPNKHKHASRIIQATCVHAPHAFHSRLDHSRRPASLSLSACRFSHSTRFVCERLSLFNRRTLTECLSGSQAVSTSVCAADCQSSLPLDFKRTIPAEAIILPVSPVANSRNRSQPTHQIAWNRTRLQCLFCACWCVAQH